MKNILLKFSIICLISAPLLLSAETVRIMPLGDSITYDSKYGDTRPTSKRTGYRSHLWYSLADAKFAADFVGSQVAGEAVSPIFDPENEGHPGFDSFEIAEKTYSYMERSSPDIVLLHIGTNDRTTTTPAGVESILNEINSYEANSGKKVKVIVALIIDTDETDERTKIFNRRLTQFILTRIKDGDNISLVDMYNGAGLTASDYADRLHLEDSGYIKMSKIWHDAIVTPADDDLYLFPASTVDINFIQTASANGKNNSVTFTTFIPSSGITF